jgi:hypothetical protein
MSREAAAGRKGKMMISTNVIARSTLPALMLALIMGTSHMVFAKAQDYRFELARKPEAHNGKDLVRVRLIHVPDGKPVPDAVIFETQRNIVGFNKS